MVIKKNLPIGIFDSGLGGLTVVKEIKQILPFEDIIYFGDIARLPYGNKSVETITRFSIENSLFLISKKVKIVVVACNTASSLALDYLKAIFKIPFIGVIEPIVKQVVSSSLKRVAVIGTQATIRSKSYEHLLRNYDDEIAIYSKACPLLVPMIESGITKGKFCNEIIQHQLLEVINFNPEALLLGCTHYPIIKENIELIMGNKCSVLSSSTSVAFEVERFLRENDLMNKRKRGASRLDIFVSDVPENFKRLAKLFLGDIGFEIRRSRSDVLY